MMSAGNFVESYRDREFGNLVDAVQVEEPVTILCGPKHSEPVTAERGNWIVFTPWEGYDVIADYDFMIYYERGDESDDLDLAWQMRYGGRLRAKALVA